MGSLRVFHPMKIEYGPTCRIRPPENRTMGPKMMETKGPKNGGFVSTGFLSIYRVKIEIPDASFLVSSYRRETGNEASGVAWERMPPVNQNAQRSSVQSAGICERSSPVT